MPSVVLFREAYPLRRRVVNPLFSSVNRYEPYLGRYSPFTLDFPWLAELTDRYHCCNYKPLNNIHVHRLNKGHRGSEPSSSKPSTSKTCDTHKSSCTQNFQERCKNTCHKKSEEASKEKIQHLKNPFDELFSLMMNFEKELFGMDDEDFRRSCSEPSGNNKPLEKKCQCGSNVKSDPCKKGKTKDGKTGNISEDSSSAVLDKTGDINRIKEAGHENSLEVSNNDEINSEETNLVSMETRGHREDEKQNEGKVMDHMDCDVATAIQSTGDVTKDIQLPENLSWKTKVNIGLFDPEEVSIKRSANKLVIFATHEEQSPSTQEDEADLSIQSHSKREVKFEVTVPSDVILDELDTTYDEVTGKLLIFGPKETNEHQFG